MPNVRYTLTDVSSSVLDTRGIGEGATLAEGLLYEDALSQVMAHTRQSRERAVQYFPEVTVVDEGEDCEPFRVPMNSTYGGAQAIDVRPFVDEVGVAEPVEPEWPSKAQREALVALVAEHGNVSTNRVKTPGADEPDHLRVQWGRQGFGMFDGGALLDATGDLVEPTDPKSFTIGLPLTLISQLLGPEIMRGHLDALRDKAKTRGESEVSAYSFDTPLATDVVSALTVLVEWKGDALAVLADAEARVSRYLEDAPAGPQGIDAENEAEGLRSLIARVPAL